MLPSPMPPNSWLVNELMLPLKLSPLGRLLLFDSDMPSAALLVNDDDW
jgi:hypothetical protein